MTTTIIAVALTSQPSFVYFILPDAFCFKALESTTGFPVQVHPR